MAKAGVLVTGSETLAKDEPRQPCLTYLRLLLSPGRSERLARGSTDEWSSSAAITSLKRGPAPPLGRIRKSGLSAAGASFPRFKDALTALRLMA